MKVLYIGRFFPQQLLQRVKEDSKGKIGFSNHNFEMSIIKGLLKQSNLDLHLISVPGVFSFPHNNRKIYTPSESYMLDNAIVNSIGFVNIVLFNKINKFFSLFFLLWTILRKLKNEDVKIMINTPDLEIELALSLLKKRYSVSTTLIVPDLPSMVLAINHFNPLKSLILKYINRLSMSLALKFDNYVLLTEAMKDFFPKKDLHYMVMEGIIDVNSMDKVLDKQSDANYPRFVLYTGTLNKEFGIMNLVRAFESISKDVAELWICGSGDAADEIKEIAESHSAIRYLGLLSAPEVWKLQTQATLLVNPRTSVGEYTKYSFPSKTMEYLLSGRPVLINRLPGIPEEYYQYVFTPRDESLEALSDKIKEIFQINPKDLFEFSLKGRNFVITRKNSNVQVKRIIEFIS